MSASRQRYLALSEPERARWLDPAEQEFCAYGYEAASMNRILAAAGESKGRTYHYFEDKGALFRATLERRLGAVLTLAPDPEVLGQAGAAAYWDRLGHLAAEFTAILQSDARLASLLRCLHRERGAYLAFAAPLSDLRQALARMLAAGQSLGAVREDLPLDLLAEVTLGLLGSVDAWFAAHADSLPDEEEALLSSRAFSLLQAPLLPSGMSERTRT